MNFDRLSEYAPQALAVLRIVAGLLFLLHGTQKLFGFPALGMEAPPLMSLFGLAAVIELVAGVLIILGLFSRIAAFVASGEMAIAYWMVHGAQSLIPNANGGELAVLYCFIFLYLVFAGPGAWSIDGRRAAASG